MGPGDTAFQERSGLGAGPRKGEDPAWVWPLVGSVEGLSRVPVEHGTGPAWPLAPSRGLSGDCSQTQSSPRPTYQGCRKKLEITQLSRQWLCMEAVSCAAWVCFCKVRSWRRFGDSEQRAWGPFLHPEISRRQRPTLRLLDWSMPSLTCGCHLHVALQNLPVSVWPPARVLVTTAQVLGSSGQVEERQLWPLLEHLIIPDWDFK